MLKLGQEAKDIITGYRGIVMARTVYLTGCTQILLTPTKLSKTGERQTGEWFDEPRVQAAGSKVIALDNYVDGRRAPGADEISAPTK